MIPHTDPPELVARLRAFLLAGQPLVAAAKAIGRKLTATFEMAERHRMERRRRSMPRDKRRKVERAIKSANPSVSEIARRYEVAKSTVSVLRTRYLKQQVKADFATHRLRQPKRCPEGHLVNEWPCITCLRRGV